MKNDLENEFAAAKQAPQLADKGSLAAAISALRQVKPEGRLKYISKHVVTTYRPKEFDCVCLHCRQPFKANDPDAKLCPSCYA
jgi:hypothetical protein